MMSRAARLAFASILVATSCLAQFPTHFHVVPVVGKLKGNAGTDWISDLSIANVGTINGTIGVHYFPAGNGNTFNGTFAKTMSLPRGRSVFVKDVIGSWFPSFGSSTSGFLVIADVTTPDQCHLEEPPALNTIVSSRTYNNADPSKTYGQSVPASLFAINFTNVSSMITGVRHLPVVTPGVRSNAGVANLSTIPITVHITTYRDDGTVAGTAQRTIAPLSLGQWGLSDLGVSSLASGRIEFRLDNNSITVNPCEQLEEGEEPACAYRCGTGCGGKYSFSRSGAYIAYVSKVDNGSGDAEFLLPSVDWLAFDQSCTSAGSSPLVTLGQRFGFGPPPSLIIRKVPRRQ